MLNAAAVLLVAMVGSSRAITLGTMEIYTDGCSSSPTLEVPFAPADTCTAFGAAAGFNFDCTNEEFEVYSTGDCSNTALTASAFACAEITSAALPGTTGSVGFGYGCKVFDDSKIVKMTITTSGCVDEDTTDVALDDISISFYQEVNTCLAVPAMGAAQVSLYYIVTVTPDTITYETYTNADCDGTPQSTITGKLGKCESISSSRRLAGLPADLQERILQNGGGVVFEPGQEGATIEGSQSAGAIYSVGPAVFNVILLVYAFVILA